MKLLSKVTYDVFDMEQDNTEAAKVEGWSFIAPHQSHD